MSLLAILGVVYGLKQLAQDGISAPPVLIIVAGLLVGFLFVRRQLGLESPIIDVRLFRIRAFSASLGTYFLGIFVVVGHFLFISQYLQLVLGLSPFIAALWSLPSALGSSRVDHRPQDHPSFPPVRDHGHRDGGRRDRDGAAARPVGRRRGQPRPHRRGVGRDLAWALAPVITLATELIVGSAPPEQAGAATGMSETSGELGGALGIAILGSPERRSIGPRSPTRCRPGSPPRSRTPRATRSRRMAVAESLPGALADAVVAAAQVAFVDALHLVAGVAAILAAVTAVVAAAALWKVPAREEPASDAAGAPVAATD